ncbi:MAG: pyridoxal-dependent decarboxylase [Holophagae bacterium]|jgi:aromatic-L-amino-acid decarboxylase
MSDETGHWDADLFRREGHRMVDWIADYLDGGNREFPVLSRVEPGDVTAQLPDEMPLHGEDPEAVWRDFQDIVLPGVTHWNHPGFMAYFGITGSGPGVLGELLSAALDVNGMLWRTCPAATELELTVLDWLRRGLELPDEFFGFLTDTASISSMLALVAAREQADPEIRHVGMAGGDGPSRFIVYASDQAHSSIAKGCVAIGLGLDGFRAVPHDAEFRMDVEALARMVAEDRAAGVTPLAVVATVGTTSTTSVDPVPAIAELCRAEGLWLHVDAAYAGSAALCPEHRWCLDGSEHADSFTFNPHKWLFTPIDASALYTRHPEIFKRAFSLVPEYLTTPVSGQVVDLMDYGVQLGRRFRALKLWWVMRCFGLEGIRDRIRNHIEMAASFAAWVDAEPDFERVAPHPFSVVCFRARHEGLDDEELDALNMQLMESVNAAGDIYLSHTKLEGRVALRIAIGNLGTTGTDVDRCRELLKEGLACLSTS